MKMLIKPSRIHQFLVMSAGMLLVVLMLGVPNPVQATPACMDGLEGCNASCGGVSISCGTCAWNSGNAGCYCAKATSCGGGAVLQCTGYCVLYLD